MSDAADKWSLTILVAHSHRWSGGVVRDFCDGVGTLLADVESEMRTEHPSLTLNAFFLVTGKPPALQDDFRASCAFAILEATDYDEDVGFLAGLMQGARIPYVFVSRESTEAVTRRMGLNDARVIHYDSTTELFRRNESLYREVVQAISQTRVIEELVYELWFPRDASTIWVVCPRIHEPGEYADCASPDYTYLDNLGDTDALLEIMVFLSRYYPRANIAKFNSGDLPSGHMNNNLVVVGGPGSCEEISNCVCQEMMDAMRSRVSYTADCDRMILNSDGEAPVEFRATLRSATTTPCRPDEFNLRRDYGYFSRFPNPLNGGAIVVLVNGIHTAGVFGAAIAFGDRRESLRNYHTVFNSESWPKSFECHFEVEVLKGTVKVPNISPTNIYPLGATSPNIPQLRADIDRQRADSDAQCSVTILFVVGDRGGAQRNQIQTTREFDSIKEAIRSCEHRAAFCIANPILAATREKLVAAYRERPTILHLAGHGNERSLSLILDQGLLVSEIPLIAEHLVVILGNFHARVTLCVLNTCDSASMAKRLVEAHVVKTAVGWPGKLVDAVAIGFSKALYGCFGDGLSLSKTVSLAAQSCGAEESPILYCDDGVDPNSLVFVLNPKQ